jgi:uroporphyrinogen-III synthase
LRNFGYHAAATAAEPDSDNLKVLAGKYQGRKFLYPCSSLSHNALHSLSWVEPKPVYKTILRLRPRLDLKGFSGIVFTSPSTVKSFFKIYSAIPPHIVVSVYGKHTERQLRKQGYDRRLQTIPLS